MEVPYLPSSFLIAKSTSVLRLRFSFCFLIAKSAPILHTRFSFCCTFLHALILPLSSSNSSDSLSLSESLSRLPGDVDKARGFWQSLQVLIVVSGHRRLTNSLEGFSFLHALHLFKPLNAVGGFSSHRWLIISIIRSNSPLEIQLNISSRWSFSGDRLRSWSFVMIQSVSLVRGAGVMT